MNNEQALIDTEVVRIKAGPHSGMFTFLHHERPIIEGSKNVMERVEYILGNKPPSEILTRLRHIYCVPEVLGAKLKLLDDDYQAKLKPLYDDYQAKLKLLEDDYQAKLKLLYDDYQAKRKPLYDDYQAKLKLLYDDYQAN